MGSPPVVSRWGRCYRKELELCEHYGTSRHTVRLAVTKLVALGLVSRRKRTGTRVEATHGVGALPPIPQLAR